ncbi:hypothetical protein WOLCODRAFT_141307 [Wolfiporia cocos MD-104 SS10]|uniref:DUF6534 domain-containing protein n=1 Tax=Wolfiporia cocos (strain MD-104) TaxID=742152 RepID=A0A2H3JBD4_WOLCO|nr:hypothetical protein WOLCODRAFT_141307 [Wolfiporia cocos MD-104 SS10]
MFEVTNANLHISLGALVIGGLASTALSGIVAMQTVLYFRLFEKDRMVLKLMVALIAFLDLVHTCLVWAADFQYFVDSFGDKNITDHVFWSAGLTIALTAITTICVHLFFSYRLIKLSKNYFITIPMVLLAFCRLTSALATSAELIRLGSFFEFYTHYRWLFTLGLVLSTALDVMITTSLCTYLRKSRRGGSGRLDHILDSMTLYTVENGMITCVATVLSLVFWLVIPHALIYLGLHFAISKLYANSFLASMNARKLLRAHNSTSASNSGSGRHGFPVMFSNRFSTRPRGDVETVDLTGTKLQITVDKTVDYVADDGLPLPSPSNISDDAKI